jgi:formiminotetrahydrofolate cyclodeaminase
MISYSTMAVEDLLDAFASSDPVPGGGSASALAGAMGVSLLMMVAGLPKTRTGTPEEAADLSEASSRLRPLRDTLTSLIDKDSAAYEAVLAAYRLPKGTDAEKSARHAAVETAMRGATEVPLDTMRACQQALRGALVIVKNGNTNAATDTGVGIQLLLASLRGAGMNVDVNTGSISDAAYVSRVKAERDELESEGTADAATAAAGLQAGRR